MSIGLGTMAPAGKRARSASNPKAIGTMSGSEADDQSVEPFFDGTKPVLRQSFCVFMDVLGFASHVAASFKAGEGQAALEQFYAIFTQLLKATFNRDQEGKYRTWDVKVFTDNIILGYAFDSWHAEPEFGDVADKVGRYQLAMALENFFVRGGMAVGDLFLDANTAFGPALLEAHSLESEVAVYPRVLLSPQVGTYVRQHISFYGNGMHAPQNDFVLCDGDGEMFVHYLHHLIYDMYDSSELDAEGLFRHKENVIKNMTAHKYDERVRDKYRWVGHYHNYFCTQSRGFSHYSNDLPIDGRFLDSKAPVFQPIWKLPISET